TTPDFTSSLIPNGSRLRISASSLSGWPVASMTTTSGFTSTTLARNSWAVSSTWDRLLGSALTLTSSSSRRTDASGSISTILMTLTSLLSCLVTCSRGWRSQLTTIVMRDSPSYSVGPTVRELMLKPRRENREAARASTPGVSSTRTDSVCRLIRNLSYSSSSSQSGAMSRAYWMLSLLTPAATIGQTIESWLTVKSITTGTSLIAMAFSMVASTSSARSQRSPTQPYAS